MPTKTIALLNNKHILANFKSTDFCLSIKIIFPHEIY